MYRTLEEMIVTAAEGVRPPERLTVAEAAEKYRKLNNPGSYVGPWRHDKTPYLVEPMNVLSSDDFDSCVFCGPAQCGKTELILNAITYTTICDPKDLLIVQISQGAARDFSKRRVQRLFRHSPDVGERVMTGRHNQGLYDTRFRSGAMLTVSWPSINELSGRPIPWTLLTDYDRMDDDVDGEGSPFDLAKKRTTTFMRSAMTLAESSPGHEVEIPKWVRSTPHECPPTRGILSLYNRGDRRRWQWQCVSCHNWFEPDFHLLTWPETGDHIEAAEAAVLCCPHCGHEHTEREGPGQPGKKGLNLGGKWVVDNTSLDTDGNVIGSPVRSNMASFWLKGVAAGFASWQTLVTNWLSAQDEYEKTGSFEALKTTTNVDQGLPFVPPQIASGQLPEELASRAVDIGERVIPPHVRFLTASIDIQTSRFVVQVHGHSEGGDLTVVDRFDVRKSHRRDEDGDRYWVRPGVNPEDWHLLIPEVIEKSYPLGDDSGRHMAIKQIVCDSGGNMGITKNAYAFWRYLRDDHPGGHQRRFQLLKGASTAAAPRVRISYPDADKRDEKAAYRGEVPVLMINTNTLKDQLSSMLDRDESKGGRIMFPNWLPDSFFVELCAEHRDPKGNWVNKRGGRNESWDLLVYAIAIGLSRHIRLEQLDWDDPPDWASDWDINSLVFTPEEGEPFAVEKKESSFDFASLGKLLG